MATPFIVAEQRGAKTKKRLAVDPVEAEIVRLMFRLVMEGDGSSGPMGAKAATSYSMNAGIAREAARAGASASCTSF